jgi:hypothetical protein
MQFVLNRPPAAEVRVSFVLLDWSCRESLHLLDYLNDQTVPRDQYEILWIEYYDRPSPELCRRIETARAAGMPPPVDIAAVLGMPPNVCYHKHLMYNVGLLLARGRIVCICDSDAMARPGLVASILRAFEADPNIVLHLDEVRNNDRRFHPFAYPDFEDVVGPGCANWLNGRPLGLSDRSDPLHTRNYGACMCAVRDDLIAIGGADMHRDYLGHICGPYELTFRLVNAGKREVWHANEWLYHVWHPGQAGDRNYAGPHDGRHMSTTALRARTTGRVEPLLPHPAIARLRQGTPASELVDRLIEPAWATEWDVSAVPTQARSYQLGQDQIALLERAEETPGPAAPAPGPAPDRALGRLARVRLLPLVLSLLWKQLRIKRQAAQLRLPPVGVVAAAHEPARKLRALSGFLARMWAYNRHLLRVCWLHLGYVAALGQREVVLYGDGDAARILAALARFLPVRIRAICPFAGAPPRPRRQPERWSEERLAAYPGMVIVAAFVNSSEHVQRLQRLGITRDRLVVLE